MSQKATPCSFELDGQSVDARPGSTLAAAAWNHGLRAYRTSVSGEPRAPLCGMGICFECRLQVDGEDHVRSCLLEARQEMHVTSGSPNRASLGAFSDTRDSQPPPHAIKTADIVVVGAGPAGIAAATEAADRGASVLLLDQAPHRGGQIWRHRAVGQALAAPGRPAARNAHHAANMPPAARRALARLDSSGAEFFGRTTVVDVVVGSSTSIAHDPGRVPGPESPAPHAIHVLASMGGQTTLIEARALIIATGARERFLPFPGWTLPGVFGIGGVQAMLKSGIDVAGERAVIVGTGPLILPVAASLVRAGAEVVAIAEQAPRARVMRFAAALWRHPRKLIEAVRYRASFRRAAWHWSTWIARARGQDRVVEATLTNGRREWSTGCSLLCVAYGLVGSTELAQLVGCAIHDGSVIVDMAQRTSIARVYCAGEPTGVAGVESAVSEGIIAGQSAVMDLGFDLRREHGSRSFVVGDSIRRRRDRYRRFARQIESAFALRPDLTAVPDPDTVICRCEDVRLGSLDPEWTGRQAKLATRVGMGACQGRVCGPIQEFLFGWSAGPIRSPLFPVRADALTAARSER